MAAPLTAEQLRLIEEKRLAALAKLAQRQQARPVSATAGSAAPPPPSAAPATPTVSPALPRAAQAPPYSGPPPPRVQLQPFPTLQSFMGSAPAPPSDVPRAPAPTFSPRPSFTPAPASSSLSSNSAGDSREIVVPLQFVSVDRFAVKMAYDKRVYAVFRATTGWNYDPQLCQFDFPKDAFADVVKRLRALSSEVRLKIELPPDQVLSVLRVPHVTTRKGIQASPNVPLSPPNLRHTGIPRSLLAALLPFQRQGVEYILSRGGRGMIADDMGLGKTIQAIAVACAFRAEWPLLIVTPSSLRETWREAFRTWACPAAIREEYIAVVNTGKDSIYRMQVVIISFELAVKRIDALREHGFRVAVVDESHGLKNPTAKRTQVLVPFLQSLPRLLLLSGTPALSRPRELLPQIQAVRPDLFPKPFDFLIRYCSATKNAFGWDTSGASNLAELALLLTETFMIRRLKSEVLTQLPEKRRQLIFVAVTPPAKLSKKVSELNTAELDHSLEELMEAPIGAHKMMMELWRETADAKLQAMLEYVSDLLESGKKFLLFAHHQPIIDAFAGLLDQSRVDYIRIDGKTLPAARQSLCDRFQENALCRVALLSITAASVGLTLHAASLVVFAELYWNPGVLLQAEDRVHRLGQRNAVLVQYLLGKGTFDDKFWPLLQRKLDTLQNAGLSAVSALDYSRQINLDDMAQTRITAYARAESDGDDDPSNDLPAGDRADTPAQDAATARDAQVIQDEEELDDDFLRPQKRQRAH